MNGKTREKFENWAKNENYLLSRIPENTDRYASLDTYHAWKGFKSRNAEILELRSKLDYPYEEIEKMRAEIDKLKNALREINNK